MEILAAKERQVGDLSDVHDYIEQLTELDRELLVQHVFDGLLGLARVEVSIADCAAQSHQFVQVESHVDDHPDCQIDTLLVESARPNDGLQHGQELLLRVLDD